MMTEYQYYYFKSAIPPEKCAEIIRVGKDKIEELKNKGHSVEGETQGETQKGAMPNADTMSDKTIEELSKEKNISPEQVVSQSYVRDSEICFIENQNIYDLIWPYILKANENAGWHYDINWGESIQFTSYKPGGFYGWHNDGNGDHHAKYKRFIKGVSPENKWGNEKFGWSPHENYIGKVRKLSMTINLNSPGDYEGGNLKFDYGPHVHGERYHECVEIRPQGSVIVFPSYMYHQVTPVTKGTRYSLVLWALGYPFK